jgi:hypothetical protein
MNAHQGISAHRSPESNIKIHQHIAKCTISGRLRDRVAGAFFKYCNNVAPFPKMLASIKVGGATGLRRDLIMDKISRSLFGNPKRLNTLCLPP